MTSNEFERQVASWLESTPIGDVDAVIGRVALQIEREPQRPAWRVDLGRQWRTIGAIAAVVAAVAIVSLSAMNGVPGPGWIAPTPEPSPTPSPSPSPRPSLTPSPTPTPLVTELTAGSHRSQEFGAPFSFVVPAGWWRPADETSAFVLTRGAPEGSENIELLFDVYPPIVDADGCQAGIDWTIPHTAADLLAYLESAVAFESTATPINVGGLEGWDVVSDPSPAWTAPCEGAPRIVIRWSDGVPVTNAGPGQSIILDDGRGRTLAIEQRGESPEFVAEASAILDSIVFLSAVGPSASPAASE